MSKYQVGTAAAAPGEVSVGELQIAVGMDARPVNIPIAVINGAKPGPTLLMEGGLHGIEIATIEVCRLLKDQINPAELTGTVVLAPQLNPWAFHASARFTPTDAQDMNRVFPGTGGSTLSFQVARVVVRELLDRADYVIDCHSCNPPSLHFTILGEEGTPEVKAASLKMAKAFGYPIVNANTAYAGTLSNYTLSQGKPTITPEFVFSRRLDATSISTGVTGCLNVCKQLAMLPGKVEQVDVPGAFDEVLTYVSIGAKQSGGLCFFTKSCGDRVEKGDTLAVLRDFWGKEMERITATHSGIVIAYPLQANQAAGTGDKIVYLAY